VFQYAKWPLKLLTNESIVSDLIKLKNENKKKISRFLKDKSKVWGNFWHNFHWSSLRTMMKVKLWSEGYKCTKTGIFCHTESVAMTLKIMCTYAHYVTLGSRCKMASSHRVIDLEKKKSSSNLQGWSSDTIVSISSSYFLLVISSFSSVLSFLSLVYWLPNNPDMDYVYPAFVPLLADITGLLFLFRKCCCSLSFPLVFHHVFILFYKWFLSLVYWPFRTRLLACLIRAAILHFSCRLHLFTSWCFVISSPD